MKNRNDKRRIEDVVEQAMGVNEVHNQLRVKKEGQEGQSSPQSQQTQGSSDRTEQGQQSASERARADRSKGTT